jgi:hypothetical protein
MYTVDLLQGRGLPTKSRPRLVALAAAVLAVPVVTGAVLLGWYLTNGVFISVQQRSLSRYQAGIDRFSEAIKKQESLEKRQAEVTASVSEISTAVAGYVQWSPILVTLVQKMPASAILTDLKVSTRPVRRKVPRKDNPDKKIEKAVPVRTLRVNVAGTPDAASDKQIRGFTEELRVSEVLGSQLEDIRVSQDLGRFEGRQVPSYLIDCVFKTGL